YGPRLTAGLWPARAYGSLLRFRGRRAPVSVWCLRITRGGCALMPRMSMDTSELDALAADMSPVGEEMRGDISAVVKKGATNIKRDMVSEARSSPSFRGFASGISYEDRKS